MFPNSVCIFTSAFTDVCSDYFFMLSFFLDACVHFEKTVLDMAIIQTMLR